MSLNVYQSRIDDLTRQVNNLKKQKTDAEETIKQNQEINSLTPTNASSDDYKRDIEIMKLNKQIEGWDDAIKRNKSEIERLQRKELSAIEKTANRLQEARTSTITNRVDLHNLGVGLEEFKKQIAASRATPSTPTKSTTFTERLTQRFTRTAAPIPAAVASRLNIEDIDAQLANISLADATRGSVRELTAEEREKIAEEMENFGGSRRKCSRRRTNKKTKRRKTNKRNRRNSRKRSYKKSKKYLK